LDQVSFPSDLLFSNSFFAMARATMIILLALGAQAHANDMDQVVDNLVSRAGNVGPDLYEAMDDTTIAKGQGDSAPEPQVPQWWMNILDQGSVTPQYQGEGVVRTPQTKKGKIPRGARVVDFDKGKSTKPNPLDKLLGRVKAEPAAPAVPALGPVPQRASGPMPGAWSQPSAMRARPPL